MNKWHNHKQLYFIQGSCINGKEFDFINIAKQGNNRSEIIRQFRSQIHTTVMHPGYAYDSL